MTCLPLNIFAGNFFRVFLTAVLLSTLPASSPAEPVAVRHVEGTLHGFLSLGGRRIGRVVAAGDLNPNRTRRSRHRAPHLSISRDGSLDDETTIFSQRHTFQLISDHRIQKGPFFPHPIEPTIDDMRSGQVTRPAQARTASRGHDRSSQPAAGPRQRNVEHTVRNLPPEAPVTNLSMLVAAPKPRVVKLVITPRGEDPLNHAGFPAKRRASTSSFSLEESPASSRRLLGKRRPPDVQLWVVGGEVPTVVRAKRASPTKAAPR